MTNGDRVREALAELSDYKIAHCIDFCSIYDDCEDCPITLRLCKSRSSTRIQDWLGKEASRND